MLPLWLTTRGHANMSVFFRARLETTRAHRHAAAVATNTLAHCYTSTNNTTTNIVYGMNDVDAGPPA